MKKSILFMAILAFAACKKKETVVEYKVCSQSRQNSFACVYTLCAKDREPITTIAECGKYKHNQVVLRVIE
jgi:uncharacterized lipoprotein YajG